MDSYCCIEEIEECPAALRFRPVTRDDLPLLKSYFSRYPSRSDDFTVGGVLMWTELYDYRIALYEDSLIIMGRYPDTNTHVFYEPRGPLSPQLYTSLVKNYCRRHNVDGVILHPVEYEPGSETELALSETDTADGWREYLYPVERFATFSGRKMEKKRNHLNFFVNNYPGFEVVEIDGTMGDELISFTLSFNAEHGDSELADYECRQVMDVLRDYRSYPFFGIAIRVDGHIAGYTFGEKSGDTFVIHAEKGDVSMRGIYQALASRLAQAVMERFPDVWLLNREDDMGFEHLRQSKLSYHPSLFIAKRIEKV